LKKILCSLQEASIVIKPIGEEIDRMIEFVADLKNWVDENLGILEETV